MLKTGATLMDICKRTKILNVKRACERHGEVMLGKLV